MNSARAFLRCAWAGSAGDEPSIVVYDAQTPLARVSDGPGFLCPAAMGRVPFEAGAGRVSIIILPNWVGASAPAAFLRHWILTPHQIDGTLIA
jgi:hypothetical protein